MPLIIAILHASIRMSDDFRLRHRAPRRNFATANITTPMSRQWAELARDFGDRFSRVSYASIIVRSD